jgi:hypothetical protein
MGIELSIAVLVIIYILYELLVKGLLWKIIFVVSGWAALYVYLKGIFEFQSCPLTISDYTFSWAFIAPTILVMLVLAYTKEE